MKNKRIDLVFFMNKFTLVMWLIITIINILNLIFWKNKLVMVFCLTNYFNQIIYSIVSTIILDHNAKVILKIWEREKSELLANSVTDIENNE